MNGPAVPRLPSCHDECLCQDRTAKVMEHQSCTGFLLCLLILAKLAHHINFK